MLACKMLPLSIASASETITAFKLLYVEIHDIF
jgi:hypothetical protein